jgi:hypothetical protein
MGERRGRAVRRREVRRIQEEMSVLAAHATYLYCAVQSARDPLRGTTKRPPRGLEGAGPPRALRAGDGAWLVVATAPLQRYGADVIDARLADLEWVSRCALAHDAVVEHFARMHPVIPMKLFTLFTSDERAVAHVGRTRRRLDRLFARVAGREEWGIRVLLDERRALAPREGRVTATSGTEFLARKKAAKDARQQIVADALAEADRLYDTLRQLADDSRRRTPAVEGPASRMVLDAAFLVSRRGTPRFRAAANQAARTLGTRGFEVSLSGPWPPYHFVADEA